MSFPMYSGPSVPCTPPVIADRLRDGQNVRFGKGAVQRRASVTAGPKAHHLVRVAQVRPPLKIFAFELRHIDQHLFWGGFPRERRQLSVWAALPTALDKASPPRSGSRIRR